MSTEPRVEQWEKDPYEIHHPGFRASFKKWRILNKSRTRVIASGLTEEDTVDLLIHDHNRSLKHGSEQGPCMHEDATDLGIPECPVIWCPDCGAVQEADPKRGWAKPERLAQLQAENVKLRDETERLASWMDEHAECWCNPATYLVCTPCSIVVAARATLADLITEVESSL